MAPSRSLFALGALAALVIACSGDGVVDPASSDSSGLSLSAQLLVEGDYGIDLKFLGIGLHSQDDKILARAGSGGVSAVGNFRSLIRVFPDEMVEVRGMITCTRLLNLGGARIGGFVTQSSDPALVGDVMVATVKDGGDDWSTGARFHDPSSGIVALEHCQTGYSNAQIGINGVPTFQKVLKGFVFSINVI